MFKEPILLLTYKRPETTKIVLNKILTIKPKKLYIFQDGPKIGFNEKDKILYSKTTQLIKRIIASNKNTSFVFKRFTKNVGQRFIAKMVLDETFKQEKKIIFLEDDTFPDISFFKYCSLMLKKYQSNESIYHISGCNLYSGLTQKKISKQNIFLSKYPHFWGWATWKSKWKKLYNPNINDWQKYKFKFLDKHMDSANERRFFKFYISRNSQKKHIGWDIPWIYKLILNNKKTIVPNFNLIKNVGYKYDPSGKGAKKFRELKLNKFINFDKIPKEIEHNYSYDDFLRKNFYLRENIFILVYRKLKKIFNEIF